MESGHEDVMSKGTIRFPESAIAAGRLGTARIRSQVAGAAAHLVSSEPAPLDASMRALVGGLAAGTALAPGRIAADLAAAPKYFGRADLALGRGGRGRMNKTEAAYAQLLEARRALGEIRDFKFESVKLRLADRTWYTPDFWLDMADGSIEVHEVKGRWQDDARVKIKVAAEAHPRYRFIAIQRAGRHGWRFEELTSRNW
jgi:hypothetical protein